MLIVFGRCTPGQLGDDEGIRVTRCAAAETYPDVRVVCYSSTCPARRSSTPYGYFTEIRQAPLGLHHYRIV